MSCSRASRPSPPRSEFLNPTLVLYLRVAFGDVEVSSRGERAAFGGRLPGGRGRDMVVRGEYYRVACPYCNDTRKRLYVNHLWCQPDPLTGEPMRHLARCFNEDCLRERYGEFERTVLDRWGGEVLAALAAVGRQRFAPDLEAESYAELAPAPPPGEVVPLDGLPGDHRARAYLEGRGFDAARLAREWEVGYVRRADPLHRAMAARVYIPVRHGGAVVGWQGRHVGDDWKAAGVPKYYTMPHFPKGRALYGGDAAAERRSVVVVEGASDAWAYGPGAVACFGKTVSAEQHRLLGAWAARGGLVALMFDAGAFTAEVPERDRYRAQGRREALVARLAAAFEGRAVEVALPDGRDPGSFPRAELRALVRAAARSAGFDPAAYDL